jgi:hypothetical protein
VREGVWLDNAIGAQLDILGRIVGVDRGQKTDDEYRTFIRGKIRANRSNGRIPDLYDILEFFDFDSNKIREKFPANLKAEVAGIVYVAEIFALLYLAKAGGVEFSFVYSQYLYDETFAFWTHYSGTITDPSRGFSSVYDPTTGGRLAGVYT